MTPANLKRFLPYAFLIVALALYLSLSLWHIRDPFFRASEDTDGANGLAAWNWAKFGPLAMKFSLYESWLSRAEDAQGKDFYTHHPAGFLIPTYITYKVFGVSEATTRLGPLLLTVASLAIFYFALLRIFGGPAGAFLTLVAFALLPGASYYGKLLDMTPPSLAMMLITFSLFVFYFVTLAKGYRWLLLASVFIGGLVGWFYYFMPLALAIFLLLPATKMLPARRQLILLILAFLAAAFLLNILQFYVLKGLAFIEDLKGAFFNRAGGTALSLWLQFMWLRITLNFTAYFFAAALAGLAVFFLEYRRRPKYALLIPLMLAPVLNLAVFRQWSTHPFGLIFFLPAAAVLIAVLGERLRQWHRLWGLAAIAVVLIAGSYFSWQKLNFFYDKFLILAPQDIVLLRQLAPQIGSLRVCVGQDAAARLPLGFLEWYLRQRLLTSPECFSRSPSLGIVFPAVGELSRQEVQRFEAAGFRESFCAGALCMVATGRIDTGQAP